ncbi:hypothetical protein [Leptothermofonsia sp. ETS-13]|uniref:hypothetical protein n=1 Tax=Leptothermofonsia sp. ETS-13 TaxID=3035696 RepID=UPI003B9E5F53
MKVWITCFVALFGAAELLQWFQQFSLPLPVFVVGGVFLAIASNYDKLPNFPFHSDDDEPEVLQNPYPPAQLTQSSQPASQPVSSPKRWERSVSFEIRKPFQPGD